MPSRIQTVTTSTCMTLAIRANYFCHFEEDGPIFATKARNDAVAPCTSLSPNMADTTAMPCAPPSCRHALIRSSPAIPPMATTGITRPGVLVTSFKPSTPSSLVTTCKKRLKSQIFEFSRILDIDCDDTTDRLENAVLDLEQRFLHDLVR